MAKKRRAKKLNDAALQQCFNYLSAEQYMISYAYNYSFFLTKL